MLICVGTPSQENGSLETAFVSRLAQEVGESLRKSANFHSVVMRSTMLPGAMEEMIIPILERSSGKRAGRESGIAYFPEFFREGTAIGDYDEPGAILFGVADASATHGYPCKISSPNFVNPRRRGGQVCKQRLACDEDQLRKRVGIALQSATATK